MATRLRKSIAQFEEAFHEQSEAAAQSGGVRAEVDAALAKLKN